MLTFEADKYADSNREAEPRQCRKERPMGDVLEFGREVSHRRRLYLQIHLRQKFLRHTAEFRRAIPTFKIATICPDARETAHRKVLRFSLSRSAQQLRCDTPDAKNVNTLDIPLKPNLRDRIQVDSSINLPISVLSLPPRSLRKGNRGGEW